MSTFHVNNYVGCFDTRYGWFMPAESLDNYVMYIIAVDDSLYRCVAKVYRRTSKFGINNGRVSKLTVYETVLQGKAKVIYNYDRGLDFDDTPSPAILAKALACFPIPENN